MGRINGVEWPWTSSVPGWIDEKQAIGEMIQTVILTRSKSRKMNNSYGSKFTDVVFASRGQAFEALARREINLAISRSLPEIEIVDISFEYPDGSSSEINVNMTYRYNEIEDDIFVKVS